MTQLPCRRNGPGEMKIFYLAGSQWICVQLTQPLAIARRPCRNMTSKVRSEDAFAVLTKGRAERQFIVEFEFLCLAAVHIPQNDIVVASTSYDPSNSSLVCHRSPPMPQHDQQSPKRRRVCRPD